MVKLNDDRIKLEKIKLPESNVSDMEIGQTVYIVPWEVRPDNNGDMWIRDHSDYTLKKQGTSETEVIRTKDGFFVDPTSVYEMNLCHNKLGRELDPMPPSENDIKIAGWLR